MDTKWIQTKKLRKPKVARFTAEEIQALAEAAVIKRNANPACCFYRWLPTYEGQSTRGDFVIWALVCCLAIRNFELLVSTVQMYIRFTDLCQVVIATLQSMLITISTFVQCLTIQGLLYKDSAAVLEAFYIYEMNIVVAVVSDSLFYFWRGFEGPRWEYVIADFVSVVFKASVVSYVEPFVLICRTLLHVMTYLHLGGFYVRLRGKELLGSLVGKWQIKRKIKRLTYLMMKRP